MEYVFLGGVYPPNKENEMFQKAKGHLSFAANKHQWNMIRGIEENIVKPLCIINTPFLPYFPRYKDLFIHGSTWSHTNGAFDTNVRFLNFRGIRNLSPAKGIYKALKHTLKQNVDSKVIVFLYTMRFSQMKAVYKLKKEGYRFNACLIVPDVPSVLAKYGERTDPYARISSKYNLSSIEKYSSEMDCYVLLSEPMKELVNVGDKPFCVVDGLFSEYEDFIPMEDNRNTKNVVYTGSLHREYGICDLLNAFSKISNPDYRLYIAGTGNAVEKVQQVAQLDHRVIYVGLLQAEEVRRLQLSADLLVNPRPVEGIDAKYSFPSKTIEYMLRGRPVLMNRLPGMDAEYEEYLFTPEKCGCGEFSDAIQYICNLPYEERWRMGSRAREFVIEQKNHKVQMKKVLAMVQTIS